MSKPRDPLHQEEDTATLLSFIYQSSTHSSVFTKVSSLRQDLVSSIHDKWEASPSTKSNIIEWHRDNSEDSAYDYILLICEAEEAGMTESIIEILTYAYDESLALSVEQCYQCVELAADENLPLDMSVHLVTSKNSEEVQEEIENRRQEAERRRQAQEDSKLTLDRLHQKWNQSR